MQITRRYHCIAWLAITGKSSDYGPDQYLADGGESFLFPLFALGLVSFSDLENSVSDANLKINSGLPVRLLMAEALTLVAQWEKIISHPA